jgi:hypothetical protein
MAAMMSGGGMLPGANDTLFYFQTTGTQYKVLPFQMTVLVEQDHIQDYLIGLENSPMAIQVNDFELVKPAQRVTKPKKGDPMFGGMYAGMGGSGGMDYAMMMMMMRPPAAGGQTTFGGDYTRMMMMSMAAPGAGGYGPTVAQRKGVDVRNVSRSEAREKEVEAAKKRAVVTIHDPYFNVVEVTVYGQARFYSPPPEEPAAEPSLSVGSTPAPAAETPKAEEPKTEPEKKAEEPKAKDETHKTAEPKAEPEKKAVEPTAKDETPKAAEPKTEPEKKAEEPKAEEKKS